MSVATGLAVASNYYAQPLLHTIGQQFSLSTATAGAIPDRADDAAVGWRPLDFVVRHQHRRTAGGHGADRTAVRRRPDPGAVRRHAGGAARTRKGGRYRHERPVAGHSAGPHRRGRTGRCGQLAHGVLGGRDPDDGHVRRPVAPAAAQPEPHVDELSAPVGLDSAHVH
ncbi:hypothetical protein G6F22_018633 [Rhizopus arrhizus]|nr:hypothetical protein G6F22_018633 [Rhizopus arrhizus]